jgi:prevent-host-death family protein
MTTMRASDLRGNFAEAVNRVTYGGERIVVERRGKRLMAMIPLEDLALLEALEDKLDIEEAEKILANSEGRKSLDEVRRELEL